MQHFVTDALFPEWKIWEVYAADSVGMALKLDSLRSSHPIQVPIVHAEEVEEVFDAISYCKGSAVINMINKVLGHENFRSGLQLYLKRHAYQNTATRDLWSAWTEAAKVDMVKLMASLTSKKGYPFLRVVKEDWADKSVTLTIQQRWFLACGSGEAEEALWNIPLLDVVEGAAT